MSTLTPSGAQISLCTFLRVSRYFLAAILVIVAGASSAQRSHAQSSEVATSEQAWRHWNQDSTKNALNIPERRYDEVYRHLFWFINRSKKSNVTFIDVGCAIGDYLQRVNHFSRKPVFSIGIDPIDWPRRVPYTKFLQVAIAQKSAENVAFNLYGSSDYASSSLKRLKTENVTHNHSEASDKFYHPALIEGAKGTSTVKTVPLSNIIQDEKIASYIDIIKVDTQGTDLEVALSAGRSLQDVLFLQIESIFSEKKGQLLYDEQTSFSQDRVTLERHGFTVFNIARFPAGPEADVMFVNKQLFQKIAKQDGIPIF